MNKSFSFLFALGAVAFASCSQDEPVISTEESYNRDFVKEFGVIDSRQDWNTVTRCSVNLKGSASEVEIYAKMDGNYRLVGHYTDVASGKSLGFDAPKACTDFYVYADGMGFFVTDGATVDLLATRTANLYPNDPNEFITLADDWSTFTYSTMTAFQSKLTENTDNTKVDGVVSNYDMVSPGEFTVYPMYWNAAWTHTLGIYWYDESGQMHKRDFYVDHEGDELKLNTTTDGFVSASNSGYSNTNKSYACTSLKDYTLKDDYIQSRGFTIKLAKGTKFGFYVSTTEGGTVYSDASLNGGKHLASFFDSEDNEGTTHTYVGFEDDPNQTVFDLNDLIIMISPTPEVIEYEDVNYVLAAEDLGATFDFDFNDVVFSVSYVAGEKTAKVKALAAGGTLPVTVYCGDTQVGGEFHSWFGDGSIPSTTMINTGTITEEGQEFEISVPEDFSLALNTATKTSMGNFRIVVNGNENIYGPSDTGVAPQMLCLPASWQWPTETTRISEAYPDFAEWGANYTKSGWTDTVVADKVVKR